VNAAALALLSAAAAFAAPTRVTLRLPDGVALVGDYTAPAKGKPVLVLLHGAGSARGEWAPLTKRLAAMGWGVVAADGRGHGQSGGPRVSDDWAPEQWLQLADDLRTWARFAAGKGTPPERVALGGASMGANIALAAAARLPKTPFVVLLSPGLDYRGIPAAEPLSRLSCPVLMAAAPDDRYSFQSARVLSDFLKDPRGRFLKAASGHGVRMLEGPENAAFVAGLLDWLRKTEPPGGGGGGL